MFNRRLPLALMIVAILLIPAMPAAAAREGVGLSCHLTSVWADCDGFGVQAWTDSSTYYVKAWLGSTSGTPILCTDTTSGVCTTSGHFRLTNTGNQEGDAGSWLWSQTNLDDLLLCAEQTLVVQMFKWTSSGTYSYQTKCTTFGGLECCVPEAITLADFSLTPVEGGIQIAWTTGSEVNNLGFNLYRSEQNRIETAVQINDALIPSKVFGAMEGASYAFLDQTVSPGVAYSYWLEDLEVWGGEGFGADVHVLAGIHPLGSGLWLAVMNAEAALNVAEDQGPLHVQRLQR